MEKMGKKIAARLRAQPLRPKRVSVMASTLNTNHSTPRQKNQGYFCPGPGLAAYVARDGMGYVIKVSPVTYNERGWYEDRLTLKFMSEAAAQICLEALSEDEGWPMVGWNN